MALRRNEKSFQVAETEADIWLQLKAIDVELSKTEPVPTPAKLRQLTYAKGRAMNQLHAKSKAMYSMKVYREPVLKILRFPGIRRSFKAQSLEIFLRGRTTEVNLKAA